MSMMLDHSLVIGRRSLVLPRWDTDFVTGTLLHFVHQTKGGVITSLPTYITMMNLILLLFPVACLLQAASAKTSTSINEESDASRSLTISEADETEVDAKEEEARRLQWQTGPLQSWTYVTNVDFSCSLLCSNAGFGYSVAMSNDGMRVAAAGPWKNKNLLSGFDAGQLNVFGGTNAATIEYEQHGFTGGKWGYYNSALTMSGDGLTVAWGSVYHNSGRGGVRVSRKSGSSWVSMGGTLGGTGTNENFGMAMSLSENGNRIVVGAPGLNSNTGRTLIYDWTGTAWQQIGGSILGEVAGDLCGKGGTSIDCGGSVTLKRSEMSVICRRELGRMAGRQTDLLVFPLRSVTVSRRLT
jgi:hypothetical protein